MRGVCELAVFDWADMSDPGKRLAVLKCAGDEADVKPGMQVQYRLSIPCSYQFFGGLGEELAR
jgi:hypothetical protein